MISQRCPKCFSNRIRRGYRPTPLWSKILFRYHLLCDSCNWEFTGFAVPGTVSSKPAKKYKKPHPVKKDGEFSKENSDNGIPLNSLFGEKDSPRKKIKVKSK